MTLNDFSERYTYDASRDLLGEGGFGRVYRAWDNEEHEYVALKMQLVDPMHLDLRLRNEFNKVQQHRHRYIARYKDCYTFNTINGEMDVAVMKYYKDGSLDQIRNYEIPQNDGYISLWTSADNARQANWDAIYWSSTETSDITADWYISYETVDFGPGDDYDLKCNSYMVRAIAKF